MYSLVFKQVNLYFWLKLGKVQNHVHDVAFAQQVSARIIGTGDIVNNYQNEMGATDASGNVWTKHTVVAGTTALPASHRAVDGAN